MRASIDLGTNTCLLLIAEWDERTQSVQRIIEDIARIVRLGQGVDGKRKLHPEAKARTLACLQDYSKRVQKLGLDPSEVVAVATSQARDASDGPEFFKEVQEKTGFKFRTLTGDQEAQATYLGALSGLKSGEHQNAVVVDIGGGSTEWMAKVSGKLSGQSLDLGSVRFTERYLKSNPVSDTEFWACRDAIDQMLLPLQSWRKSLGALPSLVGVAGTVTSIGTWFLNQETFDRDALDRCELHRGDVHRLVEELKWRTVQERIQMTGIEEGRADVLLAGAMILWRGMEVLDFPTCRVSTRGLRFGVLRN